MPEIPAWSTRIEVIFASREQAVSYAKEWAAWFAHKGIVISATGLPVPPPREDLPAPQDELSIQIAVSDEGSWTTGDQRTLD